MTDKTEVTILLERLNRGDGKAPEELLPLVYTELRKLAQGYMKNERSDHTLQATALVHEAYIRLVEWEEVSWQNRAHFFAVAAQVMRRILVDHAREKHSKKRDFGLKISLDDAMSFPGPTHREVDLIGLDNALEKLAALDRLQSKVVVLRFFGGLTIDETAHTLGISPATVKREWTVAKLWLHRELGHGTEPDG